MTKSEAIKLLERKAYTEQEAIDYIQEQICCEKPAQRFCRDKCLYGTKYCPFSMAIEALRKQMGSQTTQNETILERT